MESERRRQVEQFYLSALQREPAERAAFLAEACEGDEKLRVEIESLLAEQDPSTVLSHSLPDSRGCFRRE